MTPARRKSLPGINAAIDVVSRAGGTKPLKRQKCSLRENCQKKLWIFLPFPNPTAVESAASEEMDNIIEAKELQIERKHFYVELRENDRGKFLRITEEAHGRRNSIIVPSTGVDDFTAAISEVLTGNGSAPL
jgi:hypothetical protein